MLHLLKKEKKEDSSCVSAGDTSNRIFKQKQGAKAVWEVYPIAHPQFFDSTE